MHLLYCTISKPYLAHLLLLSVHSRLRGLVHQLSCFFQRQVLRLRIEQECDNTVRECKSKENEIVLPSAVRTTVSATQAKSRNIAQKLTQWLPEQ